MEIVQIGVVIFGLFAFSRAALRAREGAISSNAFCLWSVIWISVISAALMPSIMSVFAEVAGIGRGADFAIYVAIILLFYLIFRLYVMLDKQEQDLMHLVQALAIKKK